MAFNAFDWATFLTILLLTFALFLVITGAFTAYFGSGKSRKIGVGLLIGGLIVGIIWGWYAGPGPASNVDLVGIIVQSIGVILAAIIGAAIAIGLFLLAIMKS
ncbi:MAG: hypothetical protein E6K12_10105 [Methanobacteriota archaeon]|nr:MAG: hypothetical protein E6K12_10105 [Euryarchaeota archaeon]